MASLKYWDDSAGEWKYVIGAVESQLQYVGLNSTIDTPKIVADTIDDDFTDSALDGKWTVVEGSSGSVEMGLASTNEQETYDLTTIPGFLAMQPHRVSSTQNIELRQDYTLGVGESVVMKLFTAAQVSSNTAGEIYFGLWLNSNDSAPGSGGRCYLRFEINTDGWALRGSYTSGTDATDASTWGDDGIEFAFNGAPLYFRVDRYSSSVYGLSISMNGYNWTSMKRFTSDTTFNNIWVRAYSAASVPSNQAVPIQLVDWIRLGTTDPIPW